MDDADDEGHGQHQDDDGVVAQPLLYRLARYFLGSFHDRQPPCLLIGRRRFGRGLELGRQSMMFSCVASLPSMKPVMRPSHMTMTRLDIPMISLISEEIMMMLLPCLARSAMMQ